MPGTATGANAREVVKPARHPRQQHGRVDRVGLPGRLHSGIGGRRHAPEPPAPQGRLLGIVERQRGQGCPARPRQRRGRIAYPLSTQPTDRGLATGTLEPDAHASTDQRGAEPTQVLDHQDQAHPRRGLLEQLEQAVGGGSRHRIGRMDHHDTRAAPVGADLCEFGQCPELVDLDLPAGLARPPGRLALLRLLVRRIRGVLGGRQPGRQRLGFDHAQIRMVAHGRQPAPRALATGRRPPGFAQPCVRERERERSLAAARHAMHEHRVRGERTRPRPRRLVPGQRRLDHSTRLLTRASASLRIASSGRSASSTA